MEYWRDKVVLITGGSAGLGRVLAGTLAQRGATVGLVARGVEPLTAAADQICAQGGRAIALPGDITRDDNAARIVGALVEQAGRLDGLINCAGISGRQAVLDSTPEDFRAMWELNVEALVRCTRAAVPHLLKTGGHLVNIGSLASKIATRYLGAYPATKHAVAAYSQQLRLELGPEGLHVLLVCPGPIRREDAGGRYSADDASVPTTAQRPGGGARVKSLDPGWLSERILRACERRQPELIAPRKARLLFVLNQLSPRLGDWLVRKMT